jgi:hypothetical protein
MMKILTVILLLLSLGISGSGQNKDSPKQDATIAGTRISLRTPDGFTPSTQFSGYWQESMGSSIIVTEFPAPFSEILSGFSNPSELSKRGMSLLSRRGVEVNEQKGELLKVQQNASGIEYLKWLLIFGDEKESVMVVAAFPKELETELSEKMKASVLTAKWYKGTKVSPTEGLNFSFNEQGELKLAKRIANSLLYTKSGIFPSKAVDDPLFIIGQALSKIEIGDKEEFAKSRISQTATITDIEIEKSTRVVLDNLSGYEIIAKGKDVESGELMMIYQMILFEDQGYYIMQGLVSEKQRHNYLPAFKGMAVSFKRKK